MPEYDAGRSSTRVRKQRAAYGHLHAVHAAAVLVVERGDLGELGLALVRREGRDVGAGQHEVPDRVLVDLLAEAELGLLDLVEQPARLERGCRLAELVLGADDRAEPAHPRHPLVALVPHQRQPPAGLEDPGDLGQRPVEVEPVEGLGADDDVVGAVAGRDLLGRGLRGADVGQPLLELGEHRGVRVGGVHVVPEGDQLLGELAGARAELEHREGLLAGQPAPRPRAGRWGGRGRRRRPHRRRSGRGPGLRWLIAIESTAAR